MEHLHIFRGHGLDEFAAHGREKENIGRHEAFEGSSSMTSSRWSVWSLQGLGIWFLENERERNGCLVFVMLLEKCSYEATDIKRPEFSHYDAIKCISLTSIRYKTRSIIGVV